MPGVMKPLAVLGRILLAALFVQAGIGQLGRIGGLAAAMASHGVPYASGLVWGVLALELGGGLMLILGLFARLAAAGFFCFTLAAALLFHPYWAMTGEAARAARDLFFNHLAIMGGMLMVVVLGAGPWSLDALIFWRRDAA